MEKKTKKLAYNSTFKKPKIMASSLISSRQVGKKMESVTDLVFLGSKIPVDSDCSHKIQRCLFFGRKAMTNLDSIFKKQRRHFVDKGLSNQSYGFSSSHVWMWELHHNENWAPKNWCFWTVVLKNTLKVPWTTRRSNQSILKEISPEYSLEGLMLKLQL